MTEYVRSRNADMLKCHTTKGYMRSAVDVGEQAVSRSGCFASVEIVEALQNKNAVGLQSHLNFEP
jgi:hypothetical protein